MEKSEKQHRYIEEEINRETLIRELKEKLNMAYEADAKKMHERVFEFANVIKNKYPDYSKYQLWHLLISSTIGDNTKIIYFDFPDNDSVEKFIKST